MTEKKLVPKRRFEGYLDKLEKLILEDATSKTGDGLHGTPKYKKDGKVFFINGNNLVNGSVIVNKNTKRVSEKEQSKDDKTLCENTILMSINGTIGNLAWYHGEKLMLGKSVAYIEINDDCDKRFIYSYLQTNKVYKYFINSLTGSTIKNLGLKAIRGTVLFVPSKKEQQKIGEFFKHLDEMIDLQQKKVDKTKALKSAYLSEMFPAEGERVPKRRFAGFTNAWETLRIGDIFTVTRGNVLSINKISPKKTSKMKYPVYSSQTLNNGLLGYYDKYLYDQAITWTTDGANAGTVNYRGEKFYSTNVNGILLSNDGYSCLAVAEALNLIAWKHVSKVGNPKLMNGVMSDIIVMLPSDIEELKLISVLFNNINQIIANHQQKLEKLKATKQAYLNEMFV